jgi:hypothetical protein
VGRFELQTPCSQLKTSTRLPISLKQAGLRALVSRNVYRSCRPGRVEVLLRQFLRHRSQGLPFVSAETRRDFCQPSTTAVALGGRSAQIRSVVLPRPGKRGLAALVGLDEVVD